MVKKHQIALFLNTSTTGTAAYKRIKKSTELTISLNPETVDYDYIADESPTTELDKYKPSINQPLTMYEGEDDFDYIFSLFKNMSVGNDAKTKVMVVFMFDGDATNGYTAWESDCVISITEMNGVASTITFSILFGGTVSKGTATISAGVPTFTESSAGE